MHSSPFEETLEASLLLYKQITWHTKVFRVDGRFLKAYRQNFMHISSPTETSSPSLVVKNVFAFTLFLHRLTLST